MAEQDIARTLVRFIEPYAPIVSPELEGEASESFSIEISGMGQLTGLAYTVPAHTSGRIVADLQITAMTSEDVKALNDLAMGMLDASYREQVKEYEKTSASADASLFGWFFGGGASASYEKTREEMRSKGLTDDQITMLMGAFLERAQKMSSVKVDFYVNNTANDYAVSGDLYLYTISGSVKTSKGTAQYRMLADQAAAGGPPPEGGGAPSSGGFIPIK